MGCFGGRSHSVRSMGRQIADVSTSGKFCSDLDLHPFRFRPSTGSAPAAAPFTADIEHSLGCPDSSKAAE